MITKNVRKIYKYFQLLNKLFDHFFTLLPMISIKYIAIGCCGIVVVGIIAVILFLLVWSIRNNALYEIAKKRCKEYEKLACDHQLPNNSANEEYPTEELFPHMAFIVDKNNSNATCAGTLISNQFILTTARCVKIIKHPKVKLGSSTSKQNDTGKWFSVSDYYKHVYYSRNNFIYNIGLLKLRKTVKFSPNIRPTCLYTESNTKPNNITASGWSVDESDESFQRLRVVDLQETGECKEIQKKFGLTSLSKYMAPCFVHKLRNNTACPRSLGGSAQYKMNSKCPNVYEQFGINTKYAFFEECEGKTEGSVVILQVGIQPSIPWIVEVVWPEDR